MFATELQNLGIDLRGKRAGSLKTQCPKCGDARHKQDLSVNISEGAYKCHRAGCEFSGYVKVKREVRAKKDYTLPVWSNATNLSDKAVQWFKKRGISQQTLIKARITEGTEYMPQTQGKENTIQFNYFRGDKLVNIKYRDARKNFKMVSGAELLFYNEDALENDSVIICEGEIDALSFMEIDILNVVSVPNGATTGSMNMDYLDAIYDQIEKLKYVYLATDNDLPGISLRNELARRVGAEKCFIIDFKDCKDANEYLVKHGRLALGQAYSEAKPMPLDGIVTVHDLSDAIDEYYESDEYRGKLLGFRQLDELISFEPGQKTIITGIPNHGKSEFLDQMLIMLGQRHEWKFAVFSPENMPLHFHVAKLSEKLIGKRFKGHERMDVDEKDMAKDYLNDYFFFVKPSDEDFTLKNILDKAKQLVQRHGIKAIVIDPFNRLEHHKPPDISETNYIGKLLDQMDTFSKLHMVHIFLVAHPFKINKDKNTGLYEVPNLYSINGSANFFNKAEIGMSIYRNFSSGLTEVYVQKVRFKQIGKQGMVEFQWNEVNGRFSEAGDSHDNYNYLKREPARAPFRVRHFQEVEHDEDQPPF